MGTFTIADISVGQHIDAFGMVSSSVTGSDTNKTLDATTGSVRLEIKAPPNFAAQTLVNFSEAPQALVIDWAHGGSTTAITGLTNMSTSLNLDLTGSDKLHFVVIGPDVVDLTTAPTILADTMAANQVFASGHHGKYKTETFNTFAGFVTALAADLTPAVRVVGLAATGQYDSTGNTFTANRIAVLIND